jgi:predicted DNA binding CopG/RHH family protein
MPRTTRIIPEDVKTSFYLPARLLRTAKARAALDGMPLRTLLVRALEMYLRQRDKEAPR